MDKKIKTVMRYQQLIDRQKRTQSELYQQHLTNLQHYQLQVDALYDLQRRQQSERSDSFTLQNGAAVYQMLDKMLTHYHSEKEVLEAECRGIQQQLQQKSAKSKGLEQVVERWKKKQAYQKALKDQKIVEEVICARLGRKSM